MRNKKPKGLIITCCECGAKSRPVNPPSPAAPTLTALEVLHKESGWAYQIGFFPMMTGNHSPLCPDCVRAAKENKLQASSAASCE